MLNTLYGEGSKVKEENIDRVWYSTSIIKKGGFYDRKD